MKDLHFASANTQIRLKEQTLLTKELYVNLLNAKTFEKALQQLKTTAYQAIEMPYEPFLQKQLEIVYQDVYALSPETYVVKLFSLIYIYHNLKVLLKMHLTEMDLTDLLIPIGHYDMLSLKQVVKLNASNDLPDYLVEAVQEATYYYETYQQVEAIDILMDRAYFVQLKELSYRFDNPSIESLVTAWIDLYNVNCILRTKKENRSRSYLYTILAEGGQLALSDLIHLAISQKTKEMIQLLLQTDYADALDHLQKIDNPTSLDIEYGKDAVAHYYLEQAKWEPFGCLPILSYIYYKEMEIKNLRLILTGKDNDINNDVIKERMRPIYDV